MCIDVYVIQVLPKIIWEECIATPHERKCSRPLRMCATSCAVPTADKSNHSPLPFDDTLSSNTPIPQPNPLTTPAASESTQPFCCSTFSRQVAWWLSGYGVGLVIERSWVRSPAVPLPSNNSGQVVHTHVPLLPSSIIRYRPNHWGVKKTPLDALAPYPRSL